MKDSANIWQLFKMSLQHVAIYWILNAESFLDQNCLDLVNVGGSEINWSDSTIIAVEILRLISRKLILWEQPFLQIISPGFRHQRINLCSLFIHVFATSNQFGNKVWEAEAQNFEGERKQSLNGFAQDFGEVSAVKWASWVLSKAWLAKSLDTRHLAFCPIFTFPSLSSSVPGLQAEHGLQSKLFSESINNSKMKKTL